MKLLICLVFLSILTLPSCSLFQRDLEELEAAESNEPPFDPSDSKESLEGQLNPDVSDSTNVASTGVDTEISRLNTKISALETKIDVLSASLEKVQLQKSQPVIEANPEPNLAAPVEVSFENEQNATVRSAPARPAHPTMELPDATKTINIGAAEKEFRMAMDMFQSGKNVEASTKFSLIARKYPRHLLAGHSLYWAGEAAARAKQWSVALENWEMLEKSYPRSAYIPDTLAGLAKAYENQGDSTKARTYRETLIRAFPNSPVVLSLQLKTEKSISKAKSLDTSELEAPEYNPESTDEGSLE
jgi:TolA-binding protein